MRHFSARLVPGFSVVVVLGLVGCRSSTGGGTTCVPQQTQACACTTGAMGSQTCNAEGTAFGACMCTTGGSSSSSSSTSGGGGSTSGGSSSNGGGSSSGTAGSSSGGSTLEMQIAEVCLARVQVECASITAPGCVESGMSLCLDFYGPLTRRKVEQGFLTWNEGNVALCVASPSTSTDGGTQLSEACRTVVQPARSLGQTCYDETPYLNPDTCAQGFCPEGHGETGPCPSTCQPFRNEGDTCGNDQRCAPGLSCSAGVCTARGMLGGSCNAGCVSGLYCGALGDGGTGCQTRIQAGDSCPYDEACQSGLCEGGVCVNTAGPGARCTADGQCATASRCAFVPDDGGITRVCTTGAAAGGACAGDDGCATGLVCLVSQPPAYGTCTTVTPGTAGQPCFNGYLCAAGLFCNNAQVCAARANAGGACSSDTANALYGACATGLYCSSANTCSAVVAPGGACTENAACFGRHYCGPQNTCVPRKPWGAACQAAAECFSDWCGTGNTCVGFCTP